jgi:hypothetical protein
MPRRYETRAQIFDRVCERLRRGMTITAILAEDGMPDHRTLSRWAAADAGLRHELELAKAEGRAIEAVFWRRQPFNAAVARDFLVQVRLGYRVGDLVREARFPNRETLDRWKAETPDFADALREAVRFARAERRDRHRYDEARGDRLIQRLHAGATLPETLGREGLPTALEVRLWRRARPDFDHAVEMALLGGHRRRSAARRKSTPRLTKIIVARILEGKSLRQVGLMPDMPHYYTLYRWMRERPDFEKAVRQACLDRDDLLMDRVLEIAMACTEETARVDAIRIGAIKRQVAQMGWKPRN